MCDPLCCDVFWATCLSCGARSGDCAARGFVLSYYPHRIEALIISEESATELLLKFDGNKNGTIEKEEFFQFVRWIVAREVYDYFNTPIVEKSG